MSSFYKMQHSLMDEIEEHLKESKECQERFSNITIYGYKMSELLGIINFAKENGYKSNSELKD